ncbi:MAG: hypothetical protein HY815_00290 [Candidatus Riflebacteria bacterium]|nr:hypothetical protein [Candidatus Riflebacteria bacterium]
MARWIIDEVGVRLVRDEPGSPAPTGERSPPADGSVEWIPGFEDLEAGWPGNGSSTPLSSHFPSPRRALEHVAESFARLDRVADSAAEPLESYLVAVRALCLTPDAMADRKATFGALFRTLSRHLSSRPGLREVPAFCSAVLYLADQARVCTDPDLAEEGRLLATALSTPPRPEPQAEAPATPPVEPPGERPRSSTRHDASDPPSAVDPTVLAAPPPEPSRDAVDPGVSRNNRPLSREKLFELVTDEAFRDGQIEEWENKVLNVIAGYLRLTDDAAKRIAKTSRKKFASGQLGSERPLDPEAVYTKAVRLVCADGRIDPDEEKMLAALRKLFRLPDALHQDLMNRMWPKG